jgi:integrase
VVFASSHPRFANSAARPAAFGRFASVVFAKTLPKALPADAVAALLTALDDDLQSRRRTDWIERDRAVILTALLAGLRAG